MKHCLIVIGGPTASGKTTLAFRLAHDLNTEIISADSRQVYREMNIGVARPPLSMLQALRHHFIASHSIHAPLNAAAFAEEATKIISTLTAAGKPVVIAGGTGLYLRALLDGIDELPPKNELLREELEQQLKVEGISALQEKLKALDEESYHRIDIQNPRRLIRALEIRIGSGKSAEALRTRPSKDWNIPIFRFYLNPERSVLYKQIDMRVDEMMLEGLEEEARQLLPYMHLQALRTVGYTELFDYFEGRTTRDEAISLIKQHTRNYAKRQVTWFKNDGHYTALSASGTDHLEEIKNMLGAML